MTQIVTATSIAGLGACAATQDNGVERLETLLASHASATMALEDWCRAEGVAEPKIVAYPVIGATIAEPKGLRALLGVDAAEPLGVRQVRLACGDITLSRASNWYVPGRLTPEMNATLNATTVPFGKVVAPLGFRRETIDSRRGGGPDCPAGTKLYQRALLRLPDGQPLALVAECYLLGA